MVSEATKRSPFLRTGPADVAAKLETYGPVVDFALWIERLQDRIELGAIHHFIPFFILLSIFYSIFLL